MYPIENVSYEEWVLVAQDRKHIFNRFRNCFGGYIDILIVDGKVNTYIEEQTLLDNKEKQALKETEDILLQESMEIAKYKYPLLEKSGWKYTGEYDGNECFETSLGHELRIDKDGHILFLSEEVGFDYEVLRAIYKTAKQIKEENKNVLH